MEYNHQQMLSRIKQCKKDSGLTNTQLSELSGVSPGTLNKILSGETTSPQLPAIMSIAHAMGVSVDYLVYGSKGSSNAPVNTRENELLSLWRNATEEGQQAAIVLLRGYPKEPKVSTEEVS